MWLNVTVLPFTLALLQRGRQPTQSEEGKTALPPCETPIKTHKHTPSGEHMLTFLLHISMIIISGWVSTCYYNFKIKAGFIGAAWAGGERRVAARSVWSEEHRQRKETAD